MAKSCNVSAASFVRRAPCLLACLVLMLMLGTMTLFSKTAEASPLPSQTGYFNELEIDPDTDAVLEVLARLGQTLIRARDMDNFKTGSVYSTKRGLDLGLSRGFSGSQAAKHLMGLAAANYAGGPGRRRRSDGLY